MSNCFPHTCKELRVLSRNMDELIRLTRKHPDYMGFDIMKPWCPMMTYVRPFKHYDILEATLDAMFTTVGQYDSGVQFTIVPDYNESGEDVVFYDTTNASPNSRVYLVNETSNVCSTLFKVHEDNRDVARILAAETFAGLIKSKEMTVSMIAISRSQMITAQGVTMDHRYILDSAIFQLDFLSPIQLWTDAAVDHNDIITISNSAANQYFCGHSISASFDIPTMNELLERGDLQVFCRIL